MPQGQGRNRRCGDARARRRRGAIPRPPADPPGHPAGGAGARDAGGASGTSDTAAEDAPPALPEPTDPVTCRELDEAWCRKDAQCEGLIFMALYRDVATCTSRNVATA